MRHKEFINKGYELFERDGWEKIDLHVTTRVSVICLWKKDRLECYTHSEEVGGNVMLIVCQPMPFQTNITTYNITGAEKVTEEKAMLFEQFMEI